MQYCNQSFSANYKKNHCYSLVTLILPEFRTIRTNVFTTMMKYLSLFPLLLLGPSVLAYEKAEVKTVSQTTTTKKRKDISLKGRRASHCQGLWAKDKTLRVGNVCIEPDHHNPDQLVVSYATTDDWILEDCQIWIGRNLTELPMKEIEVTQQDQDQQQEETDQSVLEAAKEGVKMFDLESKEVLSSKSQEPALDLFPYTKLGLNDELRSFQHYGFIVKLWDLHYSDCPDTQGTTFFAVAHVKVSPKLNLRTLTIPVAESAWAGTPSPEELLASLRQQNEKARTRMEDDDVPKDEEEDDMDDKDESVEAKDSDKKQWMNFSFTIVCDLVPERPKNAPERHHANLIPIR